MPKAKNTINRPTITQCESAPVGSTLELYLNRDTITPQLWIKADKMLWHCVSHKGVLKRYNTGLLLTTYHKTKLTIKGE